MSGPQVSSRSLGRRHGPLNARKGHSTRLSNPAFPAETPEPVFNNLAKSKYASQNIARCRMTCCCELPRSQRTFHLRKRCRLRDKCPVLRHMVVVRHARYLLRATGLDLTSFLGRVEISPPAR